jgi:type III pantothenate kinase
MLLVIDIGNSNIVFGVFKGEKLLEHWRISTRRKRTSDEYGMLFIELLGYKNISTEAIRNIIISSVVPPINRILEKVCERYFKIKPLFVKPGIKTSIAILLDNPVEVGADRIANAVAAYHHYGASITVDFGTSTNFDVVSPNAEYLGGAIVPGIIMSAEALSSGTAKLPKVEIKKPARVVGKNTVECMQSGLFFGYTKLIDGIIDLMREELKFEVTTITTGGLGEIFFGECKNISKFEPLLTLEGLRLIHEKNR